MVISAVAGRLALHDRLVRRPSPLHGHEGWRRLELGNHLDRVCTSGHRQKQTAQGAN